MSSDLSFPMGFGSPISGQGSDFAVTNKQNPGFIMQPTTNEVGGLYSVIREIAGAQWLMQNADIGASGFFIKNPAFAAWAFVQQANGGFAQYTAPGTSQPGFSWTPVFAVNNSGNVTTGGGLGSIAANTSFNPLTIFNYGFYGGLPSSSNTVNNTAMINMLAAMSALNPGSFPGGGLALFQSASYSIDSTPTATGGYNVPAQSVLLGAGAVVGANGSSGQPLSTFTLTPGSTAAGNVFLNIGSGPHTAGGTVLKYLGFSCAPASSASTIILNMNGWHTVAEDCVFYNCPTAAWLQTLHGGLSRCQMAYQVNAAQGPNGGGTAATAIPQVVIGPSPQQFVRDCEMQQPGTIGSNGATGICGIAICGSGGSNHPSIESNHLVGYDYGISWALPQPGGAVGSQSWHVRIINNEIASGTCAIYMSLDSNAGGNMSLADVSIIGNTLWQAQQAAVVQDVVVIDPKITGNTISDVFFTANSIFDGLRDGVRIHGGTNIQFSGGTIGGNTASNLNITSDSPAVGSVGTVLVNGVYFGGGFNASPNNYKSTYGVSIAANNLSPTSLIKVSNCTFSPNILTAPTNITGTITTGAEIFIDKCFGYNDLNTVILDVTKIPVGVGNQLTAATAATAGGTSINYFGPSQIVFVAGSAGVTMTYKSVSYAIPANQYVCQRMNHSNEKIYFSSAASTAIASGTFSWVGVW